MIISFNFNERTSAATHSSASNPLEQSRREQENLRDQEQTHHFKEPIAYSPIEHGSLQRMKYMPKARLLTSAITTRISTPPFSRLTSTLGG
jgi:hypothetical protein